MNKKPTIEPQIAKDAVLVSSSKLPDGTPQVIGYDWNNGINYDQLLDSYVNSGFQATNFGKAVNEINKMVTKDMTELYVHYFCIHFHLFGSWIVARHRCKMMTSTTMKTTNLLNANQIVRYFWDTHRILCHRECERQFDFWFNTKW